LWLSLLKAEAEEDLKRIESMGVPVMKEAIEAYRSVAATNEFREIERLRSDARHNEASALGHARREATEQERVRWEGFVAKQSAVIANKDAALAEQSAALADKDAALAEQSAALADKDALIAKLQAQLKKDN
jgi:hypothetical protein